MNFLRLCKLHHRRGLEARCWEEVVAWSVGLWLLIPHFLSEVATSFFSDPSAFSAAAHRTPTFLLYLESNAIDGSASPVTMWKSRAQFVF